MTRGGAGWRALTARVVVVAVIAQGLAFAATVADPRHAGAEEGSPDPASAPIICDGGTIDASHPAGAPADVRFWGTVYVPAGATLTVSLQGVGSSDYALKTEGTDINGVGLFSSLNLIGGYYDPYPTAFGPLVVKNWTNGGAGRSVRVATYYHLGRGQYVQWSAKLDVSGNVVDPRCDDAPQADELAVPNDSEPGACGAEPGAADPVNVVQGNFWNTWSDVMVAGRGPGLSLARSYSSSQAGVGGPLGYGWSYSYGMSVSAGSGLATIRQENGAVVRFTQIDGAWVAPSRVNASLVMDPASSTARWTFTRGGTEVFAFDASGQLTSLSDLSGNDTTLTYVDGLVSTVTDSTGRTLTLGWTGGKITSVTAPSTSLRIGDVPTAMQVVYGYTGDDLTSVTQVDGGVWTYGYDAGHRLTTVRAPRHHQMGAAAPVVENHYDAAGRVDWQEDRLDRRTTFDWGTPEQTTVTDPGGNVVVYEHAGGICTGIVRDPGPNQSRWSFVVDPASLGRTQVTDPNGNVTTAVFNDRGLPTSITTPQGTTTIAYDPVTLVRTSVTDPQQVTTTYSYAPGTDRLTGISRPASPGGGTWSMTVSYADVVNHGRPTSLVDAMGKTWSYSYSSQGDLLSSTDPTGMVTTWTYNSHGWPLSTVSPAGNAAGGTPSQHTTTYEWNEMGQVTRERDPLWNASAPTEHQVVRTYDLNQNVVSVSDGSNRTTTYEYDAADELIVVHRPDGSTRETHYRPDGRLEAQIDGAERATTYTYDSQGRVATTVDPLGRATAYGYDPRGNMVSTQEPGGSCAAVPKIGCTTFAYDAANELIGIDYSDPATPDVTTITYDANGRRTGMTDGTGSSAWTWDSLGRLTSSTDGAGSTTSYGWDLRGQLTSIDYPGAAGSVTRHYDDAGRWDSTTDWLGRTTSFGYDADSSLVSQGYPNGLVSEFSFDAADRLVSASHAPASSPASPFASFAYTRDGSDQVDSVASTGVPADDHTFGYDALSFLTSVDENNPGTVHGYDAADNLTQLPDFTVQRFDDANELTERSRISFVGATAANVASTQTTVTAPLPGGTAPGDVVLVASVESAGSAAPSIAGYTWFKSVVSPNGATSPRIDVFRRVAQAGDNQVTATYASNNLTSVKALQVAVYRGVDTTNPIVTSTGTSVNGSQIPLLGFPDVTAGEHEVAFEAGYGNVGAASWSADAPLTQRYPQTSNVALITAGVADRPVTADGALANGIAYLSRSAQLAQASILLRPATTAYGYDNRGNRTSVTPAAGAATTYGYDQADRLVSVMSGAATVATYTYRGDGLRASKTVGATTTTFAWDESAGLPMLLSERAGDTQTNYVYGPGGRVLEQIASRPDITRVGSGHKADLGTTSNDVTATFPAAQTGDQILVAATTRNTATINTPAGYTLVNGGLVAGARTNLYRRTATGGEGSVTVTFPSSSGVGRIVQVLVYRNVDPTDPIDGTAIAFTLAASSGTETVDIPSITTTDTGGELVVVGGAVGVNPTAGTWTLPAGMTARAVDTVAPDYAQTMADTTLAEAGPTGTLSATYSAPNTNLIGIAVALRRAPTPVLYHHVDQLGSTRVLTDNNGAVAATYTYDPYGRVAATTTAPGRTINNPFGFAGQYTDPETGFQYLRARYYDPSTGQFLTRDPIEVLTREAYSYAGNNPVNFTDPTGLFWGEGVLGGIADFFTPGCGTDLFDGLSSAWQWAGENSGHLAFAATIAAYGIPGLNVVAFGFGAWSAYGNFREGHVLLGVIDLIGVGATGAALYYRAGAVSGRLGAHVAARRGQGYLVEPLTAYAATRNLRYAHAGRASFAFGSFGELLGL